MSKLDSENGQKSTSYAYETLPASPELGPGKGLFQILRRIWHYIRITLIGVKWIAIELCTKHRKLDVDELPAWYTDKVLNVVITGGARGIGAEVVKQCLQLNMNVIIGCRNEAAGMALVKQLRQEGIYSGSCEAHTLDLNSLDSVRSFASIVLSKDIPIHLLINNAGVMFPPFKMTADGFESQFQTNYLSHFHLTNLLMHALEWGGEESEFPSRIINVSSVAHYGGRLDFRNIDLRCGYSPHMGYMSSKLLQVVSTYEMDKRLRKEKRNVRVYAVHPGVVRTNLYENIRWALWLGKLFKTPEQGADAIMFTALSPTVLKQDGLYYANCQVYSVNPLALDPDVQEKLRDLSVKMCMFYKRYSSYNNLANKN